MSKVAAGPTISAFPDIDIEGQLESYNLEALKPRLEALPDAIKVIPTKSLLPDPKEVNSNLPEIIEYSFVIPGVEPTVGFQDFIMGVACASYMVDDRYQEAIKSALIAVAERVVDTGTLPSLSAEFTANLQRGVHLILSNGEPTGWRGLLAFMQGAYWLLGFIVSPLEKRGKAGISPLQYCDMLMAHNAPLGYVPR